MSGLFQELKRRNVLRVAVLYVVAAWIVLQVAQVLLEVLEVPAWGSKLVLALLLLGFPLVLIFAWAFEITPEGIKRESEIDRTQSITPHTGRKINTLTGILGAVAILLIVAQALVPGLAPNADRQTRDSGKAATASIAVLPFSNMSSDKEQEYFSDGLSEELLNLLAKIPELTVISRTSSFQFKGKNEDVRTIAQKLGVAHVLEGSVRKSANKVRITAQLIQASDGSHLWSETYDRDLHDIFAVQDEIAGEVVKALRITILGEAPRTRAATENTEAYNLLLQARHFSQRRTAADSRKAVEYLEQAVALEPGYAPAWAELASEYDYQAGQAIIPWDSGFAKARAAGERAIAADPKLSEAYAALASTEISALDWAAAAEHIRRGEALDPANYDLLFAKAELAKTLGNSTESVMILRRLTARDPLRTSIHLTLGLALLQADSVRAAELALRKTVELSPSIQGLQGLVSQALLLQGKPEQALEVVLKEKDEFWRTYYSAFIHHALGNKRQADSTLRHLETHNAHDGAYQIASVHAYRGDEDRALTWLERAYELKDPGLALLKGDPFFAPLENQPRYRALLRKLKLPES